MDDVTDAPFRQIVADCGAPDLFFTEFANADGLQSEGRDRVIDKLRFDSPKEKPLIAQIWGLEPDNFYKTALELVEMGFDGVDLNMGCPTPTVVKKGACSGLINHPELAAELIQATKEGVDGQIPVSVKIRIGFDAIQTEAWCGFLFEQNIAALSVHGRTTKELSKVPNHWEELAKVPPLRDSLAPDTTVVANGDIITRKQGEVICADYGFDGYMIGRGIFQNPFVFLPEAVQPERSKDALIRLFLKHIDLFARTWGSDKNPATLKKFAKTYIRGFDGASELRAELMEQNTTGELSGILSDHVREKSGTATPAQ